MFTGKTKRVFRMANMMKPTHNKQNLIAIIEKGGKILSVGINDMTKTNPVYLSHKGHDRGQHAEWSAIRQLKHNSGFGKKDSNVANGCSMYVFYFKRSGGLGNSKPCKHCQEEIKKNGINRLYYIVNGNIVKEII